MGRARGDPEKGLEVWFSYLCCGRTHLVHIFAVAWLFRNGYGWFFALFSVMLLSATGTVLTAPVYLKRSVAEGLRLGAVALGLYAVALTPGLEWFVPALFLKLLVGHFIIETPHGAARLIEQGSGSTNPIKRRM